MFCYWERFFVRFLSNSTLVSSRSLELFKIESPKHSSKCTVSSVVVWSVRTAKEAKWNKYKVQRTKLSKLIDWLLDCSSLTSIQLAIETASCFRTDTDRKLSATLVADKSLSLSSIIGLISLVLDSSISDTIAVIAGTWVYVRTPSAFPGWPPYCSRL